MDKWIELFSELLVNNGIEVYLLKKYVDDVLLVCSNIILGSFLNSDDKKLFSVQNLKNIIFLYVKAKQRFHWKSLFKLLTILFLFLKFTGDASVDKPIACLDSQLWVGKPSRFRAG